MMMLMLHYEEKFRSLWIIDVVAMKLKNLLRKITKIFAKSSSNPDSNEADLEQIAAQEQKHFSYETLSRATDRFSLDRKLGEGGFGPVYMGKLDDGREIAVKKLSRSSRQGRTEFQNEARLLTRIQHRNVVTLLGYCASKGEKLLVYEYVQHESLDKFLFNSNRRGELDWKKRYDIICGVAKGLHYLHEDAHSRIIHRDIKASNILLDQKWVPKIADFGMARLFPEDASHINTRVVGTNGYMAPEYLMRGDLSVKADVYSFGVLTLELVSGQRNSSFDINLGAENLLDWAYKMYKKKSSQNIMDPTLQPTAIEQQVALCVHIGLLCTQHDPSLRPTMHRVRLLLSKTPSNLEEPTRPAGFTGTRKRRHKRPDGASTSTASSSTSGSTATYVSSVRTATRSSGASTSSTTRSSLPRLIDSQEQR